MTNFAFILDPDFRTASRKSRSAQPASSSSSQIFPRPSSSSSAASSHAAKASKIRQQLRENDATLLGLATRNLSSRSGKGRRKSDGEGSGGRTGSGGYGEILAMSDFGASALMTSDAGPDRVADSAVEVSDLWSRISILTRPSFSCPGLDDVVNLIRVFIKAVTKCGNVPIEARALLPNMNCLD